MIPIQYNLQSLRTRRSTTIAAAIGIALVVFVFASVLMLSKGLDEAMRGTGSPDNVLIVRKGAQAEMQSRIDQEEIATLRSMPEVLISAAEVVVLITAPKRSGGITNVVVRGVMPESFALRRQVKLIEGRAPNPSSDEVAIGRGIASPVAGLDLGATFALRGDRSAKIVGIFSAEGSSFESEIWGDAELVRSVFNRQGSASSLTVRLTRDASFEAFRTIVAADRRLGFDARRESDHYAEQAKDLSSFISALGIAIAVFFALGAMIGAMITMYSQVAQRAREIGILRALGFRRRSIMASFVLESVLLSLSGGGFGAICALLMSRAEFSTLNAQTYSEVVFRFQPSPAIVLASLIFAVVMGLFGGLLPAVRASRTGMIAALRG